ncbi:MAG: ABC transporter substrate-binding protein [Oscillospiraceae bacterium]|nr:ABC transporter substrate-binding protein [Oscillospiraceae bacterium]
MERKHLRILALILALMMLFSACGGSSSGSSSDSGGSSSGSSGSSGGSSGQAAAPAASSGPKHLNAAIYWTDATIDPAVGWDGWTSCRAGITETLVWVDENLELKPLLADSWEQTDPTTWVFHIRDGVTFHNGNPVTAEAVKACLDRTMEIQERARTACKIDTIEADGMTLTIHTTEPYGAFLANLTEPLYSIIDVTDPADPATTPVGTGPFKCISFKAEEVIELEAYKDYWNGASPLDTVTLYVISDDSTRALALQSGQIDLGQRIGAADIETLRNDSDYAVFENSGTRVQILVMNHTNEFLKDINIRKALAYCINYDALVAITGGLYAIAGTPYPASAPYGWDQLDRQHYDLEAAKKCLADAGFTLNADGYMEKDGKVLSLQLMYDDKSMATVMEAIQSMAKAVGIKLTLQPMDTYPDLMASDDSFEIVLSNWQSLSTGDPGWFLDNMYRSDGPNNRARYKNTALDAVCDELAGAFEFADRQRLTIEAEKIILADCVNIMMFSRNNFVMAKAGVKNVVVHPIDYYFLTNTIDIE